MDHEAADVTDVGDVTVQRERLDESLAGLESALDLEREHRPNRGPPSYFFASSKYGLWAGRRVDRQHVVAGVEELSHRLGVGEVALHRRLSVSMPWRIKNALNGEIAAPMSRSICTRALRMNAPWPAPASTPARVARVGLGESGKRPDAPSRTAAVDDRPADRRAVAAEELGQAVHHDVGPPLERPDQVRRRHGVVDHQRDALGVGHPGDRLESNTSFFGLGIVSP